MAPLQFVTVHLDKFFLATHLVEAGVTDLQNRSSRLLSSLDPLKGLLLPVTVAQIGFNLLQLQSALSLSQRWVGLLAHCSAPMILAAHTAAALSILILATTTVRQSAQWAYQFNQLFQPTEPLPRAARGGLKWASAPSQLQRQSLQLLSVASTLALASVATFPLFYLLSSALQLYTLVSLAKRRWVCYQVQESLSASLCRDPLTVRFSYYYPASGPYPAPQRECQLCYQLAAKTQFCAKHYLCHECLVRFLDSNPSHYFKNMATPLRFLRGRSSSQETVAFGITLDKEQMPKCPICSVQPKLHEIDIQVTEYNGRAWELTTHTEVA